MIEAYRRGARHMTVILPNRSAIGSNRCPSLDDPHPAEKLARPGAGAGAADRSYNEALDFIAHPPADCQIEVIAPADYFPVSRLPVIPPLELGYVMRRAGYQAALLN